MTGYEYCDTGTEKFADNTGEQEGLKEAIDQERQTNGRRDHPTPLAALFNGLSKTGTTLCSPPEHETYEHRARDIRSSLVAIHKTTLNAAFNH